MTDKIYSIEEIKKIVSPIASRYGVERVFCSVPMPGVRLRRKAIWIFG